MSSATERWHHRPVPEIRRPMATVLARPIVFGLVIPIVLLLIDPWRRRTETPSLIIGTIVTVSGLAMLVQAGRDLAASSPDQLVTSGLFAHSRNPIHLGVLAMLAGLSMASRSPILGLYLLSAAIGLHLWVIGRAEPGSANHFGERWQQYQAAVPRWLPRLPAPGRR